MNIDPDAHATVSHRLLRLTQLYPQLLPPDATREWYSRLPLDARAISTEILLEAFLEGIDLILVSQPMQAKHLPRTRDHEPHSPVIIRRIAKLIWHLT